jgi:hypothetical protein
MWVPGSPISDTAYALQFDCACDCIGISLFTRIPVLTVG